MPGIFFHYFFYNAIFQSNFSHLNSIYMCIWNLGEKNYIYICKSKRRSEILSYLKSKVFKGPLGLASQQQCPSKTNLFRGLLLSLSVEEDQAWDDLKYSNLYKVLGWWEWVNNARLLYTHEVNSLSESICSSHFDFSCLESHGYSTFILMSFFIVLSLGNH